VQPLAAVLGADEVMELLGLSPPTLRRLVKDGHLRAHRLPGGRKWVFRADEVLESVRSWPAEDENEPPAADLDGKAVDPTEIWCSAPPHTEDEATWLAECAAAWCTTARQSGVEPTLTSPTTIDVGRLSYALRVGPRERVLVVDDEGDEVWQTIDVVWVEQ